MNKEEPEKSYSELMKPHLDGLFSGKYEIMIKCKEDDSEICLTEIIRLLVVHQREISQKLMGISDLIRSVEGPRKRPADEIVQ